MTDCVNLSALAKQTQLGLLEQNPIDLYKDEFIAAAGIGILLLILFWGE